MLPPWLVGREHIATLKLWATVFEVLDELGGCRMVTEYAVAAPGTTNKYGCGW